MALSAAQKKQIEVALGSKKADGDPSPAAKAIAGTAAVMDIAAVSTADGSDAATTQALANALKAKINEILAAHKAG